MKSNLNAIEKASVGIVSVAIANSYWSWVEINGAMNVVFVGLLLQVCLSFFIWLEGFTADKWKAKGEAKKYKIGRGITSYISLVGGKFVTMGITSALFGGSVVLSGYFGGLVAFFGIIFLIMGLEKIMEQVTTGFKQKPVSV
ncbi:hypothetical protein [Vibrio sp. 99-70-13A1]|uniref:hypothetical protein n=1 Tax=Vibrio sp. 99-70-13A1 TaxID=2607601 RepID=UPI00149369A0|nr:hypothetical protein [Vibrio sp. 99-70-13A1]NOH95225.1 hypothetical protein [Vibrio sp. 99-70-13A1]